MILVFSTEAEAATALRVVNTNYGCAYKADSGYVMSRWDTVKKALTEDKWYFTKPKNLLGVTIAEAMKGVAGFVEQEVVPEGWRPLINETEIAKPNNPKE